MQYRKLQLLLDLFRFACGISTYLKILKQYNVLISNNDEKLHTSFASIKGKPPYKHIPFFL